MLLHTFVWRSRACGCLRRASRVLLHIICFMISHRDVEWCTRALCCRSQLITSLCVCVRAMQTLSVAHDVRGVRGRHVSYRTHDIHSVCGTHTHTFLEIFHTQCERNHADFSGSLLSLRPGLLPLSFWHTHRDTQTHVYGAPAVFWHSAFLASWAHLAHTHTHAY